MKVSEFGKLVLASYAFGIPYSIVFGLVVGVSWPTIIETWYKWIPAGIVVGLFASSLPKLLYQNHNRGRKHES